MGKELSPILSLKCPNKMEKIDIIQYFKSLQDQICEGIAEADGQGSFKQDIWTRKEGGGGQSRVIQHGKILEKAGVNFSAVHGPLHPKMVTSLDVKEEVDFMATGVSIVMHPFNPWVPIIHMNVRYFELSNGQAWFGGGIDLTPHIIIPEQAKWFHQQVKASCDGFGADVYTKYKTWADDYFFNTHRNETRGIGGIFFDYLKEDKVKTFDFVKSVGESFVPIYSHLMKANAANYKHSQDVAKALLQAAEDALEEADAELTKLKERFKKQAVA